MADDILSVITVTYNNEKHIKKYLTAVQNALPKNSEIIIVDNNSTDKTVDFLSQQKDVVLIKNTQNLGFSKANNFAVSKSKGEFLFFLNPDTEVIGDTINLLLTFYTNHVDAGIVAPRLIESSGKVQPSVRKLPTIFGAVKEYYLGIKSSYDAYAPVGLEVSVVESVVGGAFMIKKDVFNKVGGFNEKYFMYFEDLELCKKILKFGLKIYYLPQTEVVHEVGGSFSPFKAKWINKSAQIYHGSLNNFILNLLFRSFTIKNKLFKS